MVRGWYGDGTGATGTKTTRAQSTPYDAFERHECVEAGGGVAGLKMGIGHIITSSDCKRQSACLGHGDYADQVHGEREATRS